MIEARVSRSKIELQCSGSLMNICAEVGTILQSIYRQLHANDPRAAKTFRQSVMLMVAAPDSPLWIDAVPDDPNGVTICKTSKDPVTSDMLNQMIGAGASADLIGAFLRDDC